MTSESHQKLTAQFVADVLAQEECIARGDAVVGNRHADGYIGAARQLLNGGATAVDAFAGLLSHPADGVRAMAAAFLLKERTEAAVAVLRPLARGRDVVALGARETLKRYERGDVEMKW
jgi:HEAT repeat protein